MRGYVFIRRRRRRQLLLQALGASLIALAMAPSALAQCEPLKRFAGDVTEGDQFGAGLSLSGAFLLVGSPCDDDNGISSGGAYIFGRDHGGTNQWGQVTKLMPTGSAAGDELGFPVWLSGDMAIVGARLDDVASFSGAAYIFARHQDGRDQWGQVAKLTASDGEFDDIFGQTVSIDGDFAIVGAPRHDVVGSNSGAAYIFARNHGGPDNWGELIKLIPDDAGDGDRFGQSVSIHGDIAVVGAFRDDDADDNAGAAYVFGRNEGGPDNWGLVTKLIANDGQAEDQFGYSVEINNDTLLVAARRDDDNGENSGSAYIFTRDHGGTDQWGFVKKLLADDGSAFDGFGDAIAIKGDLVVVSAPGKDVTVTNIGAAYLFARHEGGTDNWGQVARITVDESEEGDRFGFPAGINGQQIVLGAYGDDDNGEEAGSFYVFEMEVALGVAGDVNDDCIVDDVDRTIFCAAIGSSTGEPAYLASADLNEDGVIDEVDLALFNEMLPACAGDVVSSATFQPPPDGHVDGADLAYLLGAWESGPSCADVVSSDTFLPPPDGVVDGADLAFLLGAWGECE